MKNRKGFTLTEILLAVMVVAIIGVALASLTTAASREGGTGRTRTVLRNGLSRAIRQLRQDVQNSTRVLYAAGPIASASAGDKIPLLVLGQNIRLDGTTIPNQVAKYVVYCFEVGNRSTLVNGDAVQPETSLDEGKIYRYTADSIDLSTDVCDISFTQESSWLHHVKWIPSGTVEKYPVPLFAISGHSDKSYNVNADASAKNLASTIHMKLILELPSAPVVNDVTEEIFMLRNGFIQP